jgi:protein O-GlcNAc transferase
MKMPRASRAESALVTSPQAELDELVNLARRGLFREALRRLDCLVAAYPSHIPFIRFRAWVNGKTGDYIAVERDIHLLEGLGADVANDISELAMAYMHRCEWAKVDALYQYLILRLGIRRACIFNSFAVLARSTRSSTCLQAGTRTSEAVSEHWASQTLQKRPGHLKSGTKKRLRIGYLSGQLYDHTITRFVAAFAENHDAVKVETFLYDYSPNDHSNIQRRVRQAFEHFVSIDEEGPFEASLRIKNDGIDILVDLMGFQKGSRSELMFFKPAPIQVNFLGYPASKGDSWTDYVIADNIVIPPSELPHWTEKVIYMPHTYFPCDRKLPSPNTSAVNRYANNLPDDGIIFAAFNSPYKITEEIFDTWSEILKSLPTSILWIYGEDGQSDAQLVREITKRNLPKERLVFAPTVGIDEHICRHSCADIFLDTYPYNGHSTAITALWAGLPLITLYGDTFHSRVAKSLLHAVGLSELCCQNREDYIAKAIWLATDRQFLASTKSKLIDARTNSTLFDAVGYARALESGYERAFNLNRTGKKPENIYID